MARGIKVEELVKANHYLSGVVNELTSENYQLRQMLQEAAIALKQQSTSKKYDKTA